MIQAQQTLDARKQELARKRAENDLLNRQIEDYEGKILEPDASPSGV